MSKLSDAAQKERAWFRRQKGYLRDAINREMAIVVARLLVLEDLLMVSASPTAGASPPAAAPILHEWQEGSEPNGPFWCIACNNLATQGVPAAVANQIHDLHQQGDSRDD